MTLEHTSRMGAETMSIGTFTLRCGGAGLLRCHPGQFRLKPWPWWPRIEILTKSNYMSIGIHKVKLKHAIEGFVRLVEKYASGALNPSRYGLSILHIDINHCPFMGREMLHGLKSYGHKIPPKDSKERRFIPISKHSLQLEV